MYDQCPFCYQWVRIDDMHLVGAFDTAFYICPHCLPAFQDRRVMEVANV